MAKPNVVHCDDMYTVSGKKKTEMSFVISSIQFRQFWWNLVH